MTVYNVTIKDFDAYLQFTDHIEDQQLFVEFVNRYKQLIDEMKHKLKTNVQLREQEKKSEKLNGTTR